VTSIALCKEPWYLSLPLCRAAALPMLSLLPARSLFKIKHLQMGTRGLPAGSMSGNAAWFGRTDSRRNSRLQAGWNIL
jgi:hypothetical protein